MVNKRNQTIFVSILDCKYKHFALFEMNRVIYNEFHLIRV